VLGWEYLVVRYEVGETALADLIPSDFEPIRGSGISFEWCRTLSEPKDNDRIDASVVVPCRHRDRELGYQLRHYCDQLRPARIKAGVACDGGPDFFAKLLAAPQLRTGTLHDGEVLVAAAILSPSATGSSVGGEHARRWMALPRLTPTTLDDRDGPDCVDRQLILERNGAVTFQLRDAPSGAFVAPAVKRVLYGQFFTARPNDDQSAGGSQLRERRLSRL
jgi:hypothetical protein